MAKRYFDKHGKQIKAGMKIKHDNGDIDLVYLAKGGDLGLNASNENFAGFDPMYRELYPLSEFDMKEFEIVKEEC
jgi:hypothetical protein